MLLKISTATTVTIGPVLDADGAAVTTAVVTNFSIVKNGSSAALTTETLTHVVNGYYTLALTSGNTNTLGNLEVFVNNTAMSMTVFRYNVIAAQVYDSIVSGSDLLQIDIQQLVGSAQDASRILIGSNNNHEVQVTGSNHVAADIHELQVGVITAADFAAGAIDATVLAVDSITSSQIAASAVTEIQSGLATTANVASVETDTQDIQTRLPAALVSGRIDASVGAMAANTVTASAIATDAVSEIQAGLATTTQLTTVEGKIDTIDDFVDTEVSAIKAKTDQLSFTVANQVDANALTGGGGGSSSIVVTPVVAQTPVRATATTITTYKGDRSAITVGVFSGTTPVNLSTLGALEVCIQTKAGTDLQLIAAANITISGTSSNYFSFSPNSTAVGTVGRFMWSLRVAASGSKQVIVYGAFVVEDAALAD